MKALISIIEMLLGYGALTIWVSHLSRAIRQRKNTVFTALLALPVILLALLLLPGNLRLPIASVLLGVLTLVISKVCLPDAPLIPTRETKPTILHLVLITGSAIFLIPFAWMLSTSLKADAQLTVYPPVWIPSPVVWKNFPEALKYLPPSSLFGLVNLGNTLIIAVMSCIGTVLSCSLVAYGFSRFRWPGKDVAFGLLLATMMLPDAVTMMPRFLIFRDLHWIDTLYPLWVPSFFASAFNVFLLRQFFLGIPQELEDAAKIDGCSYFATWWRIMLPMVKTPIAAVTIMTFLGAWKDFMNPLIYISSPEKMPLSYILQLYNSSHGGEPGYLMAVTTLVILPVVILFFFTQRYFVEGISLSGLGGR